MRKHNLQTGGFLRTREYYILPSSLTTQNVQRKCFYGQFPLGDRALSIYDVFVIFDILQNHNQNINGSKQAILQCNRSIALHHKFRERLSGSPSTNSELLCTCHFQSENIVPLNTHTQNFSIPVTTWKECPILTFHRNTLNQNCELVKTFCTNSLTRTISQHFLMKMTSSMYL